MSAFNLSNYPPGVTGNEYAIAGPDAEEPAEDFECPNCQSTSGTKLSYQRQAWIACNNCDYQLDTTDDYDNGPDPDAAYDKMREERDDCYSY